MAAFSWSHIGLVMVGGVVGWAVRDLCHAASCSTDYDEDDCDLDQYIKRGPA
jgi:hypothetical protein